MRTHYCGQLNTSHLGKVVTLCGWAHRRRDHGGVIFIDLRDREGLVQVVIDPDTPNAVQTADKTRSEATLGSSLLSKNQQVNQLNQNLGDAETDIKNKDAAPGRDDRPGGWVAVDGDRDPARDMSRAATKP